MTAKNRPITVRTNSGDKIVVELVGGGQPYLWIGQKDEQRGEPKYLGSVTIRAVLGAVKRSKA